MDIKLLFDTLTWAVPALIKLAPLLRKIFRKGRAGKEAHKKARKSSQKRSSLDSPTPALLRETFTAGRSVVSVPHGSVVVVIMPNGFPADSLQIVTHDQNKN